MPELEKDTGFTKTGKTEDSRDAKGLAFLLRPTFKDGVTEIKTYSNRVIKTEIYLQGIESVIVVNANSPTSSAEDERVKQLYDDIERAMADSDSKNKITAGDFNAKVGTKIKKKTSKAYGYNYLIVNCSVIVCTCWVIVEDGSRDNKTKKNCQMFTKMMHFKDKTDMKKAQTKPI